MQLRFRMESEKDACHVIEGVDWVEPIFYTETRTKESHQRGGAYIQFQRKDWEQKNFPCLEEIEIDGEDFVFDGKRYDFMTVMEDEVAR